MLIGHKGYVAEAPMDWSYPKATVAKRSLSVPIHLGLNTEVKGPSCR